MQTISNSIQIAHQLLKDKLNSGGVFLDGTLGNGNDTCFMIQQASPNSTIYGFDIQLEAIEATKANIKDTVGNLVDAKELKINLIHDSHANISQYVKEAITGAIFNLGYLPNASKEITTLASSSLQAIEQVLKSLAVNGVIAIVLYPGHEEGEKEYFAIEENVKKLPRKFFTVGWYKMVNHNHNAPALCWIEKVGDLNESNKTCKD